MRSMTGYAYVNKTKNARSVEVVVRSLNFKYLDVFVRKAASNLGHNLEYQFDWGDGSDLTWGTLTSQKSDNITVITTPVGGSGLPSNGQMINYLTGVWMILLTG